jgi:thiamine transporter ThiT
MGYTEMAGHPLTYAAVVIGILYVLGFTIICLRRAWKRALAAGFERRKLWGIIKTSVSFALPPVQTATKNIIPAILVRGFGR